MSSQPPLATPTTELDFCNHLHKVQNYFLILFLPAAIFILIVLSFLRKREQLCLKCCWGRPYLVYPVNFIDEHQRRWAYLPTFAMMTTSVMRLFRGKYIWNPINAHNEAQWGWAKTIIGMGNIIHICLLFYPFAACVSNRNQIIANILGLAYVAVWAWYESVLLQLCPPSFDVEGGMDLFYSIPMYLSFLVLVVAYVWDLGKNIRKLCCTDKLSNDVEEELKRQFEVDSQPKQYVKELLAERKIKPKTFKEKLKHWCTYTRMGGFEYPPRVMCSMIVSFLALYEMVSRVGYKIQKYFEELYVIIEDIKPYIIMIDPTGAYYNYAIQAAQTAPYCLAVANYVSAFVHLVFIVRMILSYRKDLRKMFKGQRPWGIDIASAPDYTLVGCSRYAGYQIAFIIWGYTIVLAVIFIFTFALANLVILPIKNGHDSLIVNELKRLWPVVVVSIVLYVVQRFVLARFVFLQDRGAHLALNNRHLFHATTFIFFFFDILLGVFSCLKRIILSMLFGMFLISRLDFCLMMRGFERFDAGFRSYLCMLTVEVYHNHPVMKCFLQLLQESAAFTRFKEGRSMLSESGVVGQDVNIHLMRANLKKKRVRIKWWKMVTLARNPLLVLDRMKERIVAEQDGAIGKNGDISRGHKPFLGRTLLYPSVDSGIEEETIDTRV